MLNEVYCDKFNSNFSRMIKFKNGLNIISGENNTSNSIGKTTVLMIIDFCFGGIDIIKLDMFKSNKDYSFNFMHIINNKKYYYNRNLQEINRVNLCDSDYNKVVEITIEEFRNQLKNLYYTKNILSFRQLQNPFIRAFDNKKLDKNNYLCYYGQKNESTKIIEDLFNKLNIISKKQIEYEKNKKMIDAYKKLSKEGIFSSSIISKKEYKKLRLEAEEIDEKILRLDDIFCVEEEGVNDLIINLFRLNKKLMMLEEKYDDIVCKSDELYPVNGLTKIYDYFNNINLRKLEEIYEFHNGIKSILNFEYEQQKIDLENKILECKKEIEVLRKKLPNKYQENIFQFLNNNSIIKYVIRKKSIEEKIDIYIKYKAVDDNNKKIAIEINKLQNQIVPFINKILNEKMIEINKKIIYGNTKIPMLNLTEKGCDFSHIEDDGSGCLSQGMIVFDLALLNLSDLVFVIHDKDIIIQIDKKKWTDILLAYEEYSINKQAFVVLDDIDCLEEKGKMIVQKCCVLKLCEEYKLFE